MGRCGLVKRLDEGTWPRIISKPLLTTQRAMEEPKFNNKIEDLEDQLWDIKQRLEYVESVLEIEPEDDEDDYDLPTMFSSECKDSSSITSAASNGATTDLPIDCSHE